MLPEGDPDRTAFLEHARGCAECMEAFRQGEKLQGALARVQLPPPSQQALQRAREAVLAELRPRTWPLRVAACVLAFAVPVLFSRHRDWEGWAAAALVLVAATALSAAAGTLASGGLLALAASAGFAFAAGGVPGFPAPVGGPECLLIELGGAALPLAAAVFWYRRDPRPGSLPTAAAAGALAAQAALHLVCGDHTQAAHLWVFHVGGVALAAGAAWALERGLYASSARN